jgi:hypothetical protein
MADHHVELAGGWLAWKWLIARGAGFPAAWLIELGAPEAVRLCDELSDEDAAQRARTEQTLAMLRERIAENPTRFECVNIEAALVQGRVPGRSRNDARLPEALRVAIGALVEGTERLTRGRARLDEALESARRSQREVLRRAANDPRFREAVVWQNRDVLEKLNALARDPVERNDSRTRQRELAVWRYLQRYCAKNDTIGFFGPICWGRFGAGETRVAPGPTLLAEREVYLEQWAVNELALGLVQQHPGLRPWLPPRRLPSVHLDGDTVHYPIARTTKLPAPFARLLAACDGDRSARELATELVADPSLELESEEEVLELLEQLVEKKLVTWTLEVPVHTRWPEREMRKRIELVAEPTLRAACLAALERLVAARDAVARAAGDEVSLARALADIDATFTSATGAAATRSAGQNYAARTIVYEDCKRDLDIEIGAAVRARIAAPMELLLLSARWFTDQIGQRYTARFEAAYDALVAETGIAKVDFTRFVASAVPDDQDDATDEVAAIGAQVRSAWGDLLALDMNARRVERTALELRRGVAERFAAKAPGWAGARIHSPDLMIAARDVDAIRAGDYLLVVGEIHAAYNTPCAPVMAYEHGDVRELGIARGIDVPRNVLPVRPERTASRVQLYTFTDGDYELESGTARSRRPPHEVLHIGELYVERGANGLVVRSRARDIELPLLLVVENQVRRATTGFFKWAPDGPHVPRVTIDGMVVVREAWRIQAADVDFLDDGGDRFLRCRRWARALGVPRFVFTKFPDELKPIYLDLESPLAVEAFAKSLRKSGRVTVSEMLPSPEDLWLTDREGRRYTAELRFVAVDPVAWPAASSAETAPPRPG